MPRKFDEPLRAVAPPREDPDLDRDRARLYIGERETERRRIAAELHDQVGASLAAIKLMLQTAADGIRKGVSVNEQLLAECQEALDDTIRGVRDLCAEWRPATLDYQGLVAALKSGADRFVRRTGIAIELDLSAYERPRSPEVELMLLRIVQEALRNCAAHARASQVRIVFCRRNDSLALVIEDNGQGFDANALGSSVKQVGDGIGLLNMRERALVAGAAFSLDTAPGRGTRIVVAF